MMTFSKSDFWRAFIAGGFIAFLALPVLKNLGAFDLLIGYNNAVFYLCVGFWIIFLPIATASGLYVVYSVTISKWPIFYQLGKYGIIGLLNTFLDLGILNLLILLTGIARGLWLDLFVVIAFCTSITNAFFWNKFWTFSLKNTEEVEKEYVKFFAVAGATALINIFLMHVLVNIVGAPFSIDPKTWVNIAAVSLIPVSFFGNFFGWKFLVFKV